MLVLILLLITPLFQAGDEVSGTTVAGTSDADLTASTITGTSPNSATSVSEEPESEVLPADTSSETESDPIVENLADSETPSEEAEGKNPFSTDNDEDQSEETNNEPGSNPFETDQGTTEQAVDTTEKILPEKPAQETTEEAQQEEPAQETTEETQQEEPAQDTTEEVQPEEPAQETTEEAQQEEPAQETTEEAQPEEPAQETTEETQPEEPAQETTEESQPEEPAQPEEPQPEEPQTDAPVESSESVGTEQPSVLNPDDPNFNPPAPDFIGECPEECIRFVQGWKGDTECDIRCYRCPQFWNANGEFDNGDCSYITKADGEIDFDKLGEEYTDLGYDDGDWTEDVEEIMDNPDLNVCEESCTESSIGDGHCDKVACKYCDGTNGPDFYNSDNRFPAGPGLFDGGDCCNEICKPDWKGDGECDDDSNFYDFSCMQCGFMYDKNGVYDGDDCCPSRCDNDENKLGDGQCDEMCAQCSRFFDNEGVFDKGDCGGVLDPHTGLNEDVDRWQNDEPDTWDFDTDDGDNLGDDEGWQNRDEYWGITDEPDGDFVDFDSCPEECTNHDKSNTNGDIWVGDHDCDFPLCQNCPSFYGDDGLFDGGDCVEQIEEFKEKKDEIEDYLQTQGIPEAIDNLGEESTQMNVKLIAGLVCAAIFLVGCIICCWRRKARYDFDDSGYGHSYDKGWNEMASFTNWA